MSKLAIFAFAVAAPFPWRLRRLILQAMCGFVIHKTAFISRFALVSSSRLEMGPRSHIGPLTVCKGLELLRLGECAIYRSAQLDYRLPSRNPEPSFRAGPGAQVAV